MKINWNRFCFVFVVLMSVFYLTACTAAWLAAINGMLPGIESVVAAIVSFVVALEGKTVSPATVLKIQQWEADVSTQITNAQNIIAQYQAAASTGLLSQLQAVMQGIMTSLNSILTGLNITDSTTVAKITQFLALGVAAVSAVLALIPMAMTKLDSKASNAELLQYDKLGANAMNNVTKTMKETYAAIIQEKTSNLDVNAALDSLPKSI
jgi:hypothetical protein